jgi:transposase
MPHYVGLDVSQKTTTICIVDEQGQQLWRGACATDPAVISARVLMRGRLTYADADTSPNLRLPAEGRRTGVICNAWLSLSSGVLATAAKKADPDQERT